MKSKASRPRDGTMASRQHRRPWPSMRPTPPTLSRLLVVGLGLLGLLHQSTAYESYRVPRSYDVQQQQHYPQHQQQQQQQYSFGPRDYYPQPPLANNYQKYYKQFLPAPQYCPETGRTVCSRVAPYYPTEEVFNVIKMARAKHFNISSEFVDEADNDDEPQLLEEEGFDNPLAGWVPAPDPFRGTPGGSSAFSQRQQQQQHDVSGGGSYASPGAYGGQPASYHQPVAQFHNYDYNLGGATARPPMSPTFGYKPYEKVVQQHQQQQYYGGSGTKSSAAGYSYPAAPATHRHRYKRQAPGDGAANEALPNEPICPSRTIIIEPRAAMNDRSQWKFVVNLAERDPRLKQAIKVEVCRTPNRPCSSQISLPFGFTSRCRQKYIKKKLISLDPSGQSISSENFFAPSCCVCEVIRIPPQTSAVPPPPPPPPMGPMSRSDNDEADNRAATSDDRVDIAPGGNENGNNREDDEFGGHNKPRRREESSRNQ